ncbi:MAG: trans-2-enoyl-CoA reductase family protein [Kiritimatiellaeota bacterium]|nr:trans-2-enoyl-CoA reductase family protein [Kiritimatiellota bacterium]
MLVLGCSGGYGLASRIVAAFGCDAQTLGVSLEREPADGRDGSPGWYNNLAFDEEANTAGLTYATLNADAFANATRDAVARCVTCHDDGFAPFDLVIYSLASPVRTDPETGEVYRSVIKPIGAAHTATTVDFMTGAMRPVTLQPATDEETRATVKVMGGEDWLLWMKFLKARGLLAEGAKTVAFSYIGPACTQGIYRNGTLGKAKEDLEATAETIHRETGTEAYVSINKALVTRASAVIPAMPPYIAALYKVMKAKGLHEGCLEQMARLFYERLYAAETPVDDAGRIRLDDWEMRDDVQAETAVLLAAMTAENAFATTDLEGYQKEFLALHGF